jgi:murein DD-endopeptidase MepM/ murein hydrolase activator NlpD
VGATGLATGTHHHYEFLQNGNHRNPLAGSVPSEPSLEKVYLGEFRLQRDRALALLEGLAIPRDAVVASAAPAPDANDRQ